MNSLNILSAIGSTPPPSPPRSRAGSESDITRPGQPSRTRGRSYTEDVTRGAGAALSEKGLGLSLDDSTANEDDAQPNEKTPLIAPDDPEPFGASKSWSAWMIPKRVATAALGGVRAVFAAVVAPVQYLAACFYDDDGNFSTLLPLYRLARMIPRKKRSRSKNWETTKEVFTEIALGIVNDKLGCYDIRLGKRKTLDTR
ncbi:putative nli interacting factor [Diplodia seriata]|uniref:Putative nli interacting factor n=1 Tax=Diplodia seriata TaxID=420778 RepID=A0A0G2EM57_9PEZI|nr:putative nli interacting factor [Diplodia seriata]